MIAARILAYGKDYQVEIQGKQATVDLSELENKEIDLSGVKRGQNEFPFTLPHTDNNVTFKLLTHKDEQAIEREIAGLKKIDKDNITTSTTRLKHLITSINGLTDKKDIREFVDNYLLAKDARALREEYNRVNPAVDLPVYPDGFEEGVDLPITIAFFWPDSRV